jgi:beta-galactosidase/beta-glucuronidase
LLDALGVLAWDETRDFGMAYLSEMQQMVASHRNHPSIAIWSLCNEYECVQADYAAGAGFRASILALDPGRPISANSKEARCSCVCVCVTIWFCLRGATHWNSPQ